MFLNAIGHLIHCIRRVNFTEQRPYLLITFSEHTNLSTMPLSILRKRETKKLNSVIATLSNHQLNPTLNLQQQKIGVEVENPSQKQETMAHQSSRQATREVQHSFGKLYDRAAGLTESFRPCDCGTGANAEDDA